MARFPVSSSTCIIALMLLSISALSIASAQETVDVVLIEAGYELPNTKVHPHEHQHMNSHAHHGHDHKHNRLSKIPLIEACPLKVLNTCASLGAVVEKEQLAECLVNECLQFCKSHHGGSECQVACGVLCCDAANDLTCLTTERNTCNLLCSEDCDCRCSGGSCKETCLHPTCSPVDLQTCEGVYNCTNPCECTCKEENCIFTCEGECDAADQSACDADCGEPCACVCDGEGDCTVRPCPADATCDPSSTSVCDSNCDPPCTCECDNGTCEPSCAPEDTCSDAIMDTCNPTCESPCTCGCNGTCEAECDTPCTDFDTVCTAENCPAPKLCDCECTGGSCGMVCNDANVCTEAELASCVCDIPCVCNCVDNVCQPTCPPNCGGADPLVCDPICDPGTCACICYDGGVGCNKQCLAVTP